MIGNLHNYKTLYTKTRCFEGMQTPRIADPKIASTSSHNDQNCRCALLQSLATVKIIGMIQTVLFDRVDNLSDPLRFSYVPFHKCHLWYMSLIAWRSPVIDT